MDLVKEETTIEKIIELIEWHGIDKCRRLLEKIHNDFNTFTKREMAIELRHELNIGYESLPAIETKLVNAFEQYEGGD